ncbi:MAG: redoxin domain-containing protein [Planctomycetaceae bacterium]
MFRFGLVATCCLMLAAQLQGETTKSSIGKRVENFTLSDYRGKEFSLSDFSGKKAVVVAFLGTECPLAKLYAPRLSALEKKFSEKGIAVIGINSNRQDAVTEIGIYAKEHGIEFPMLKDVGNKIADRIGATRTPEVFLLDADGVVRYHGRIDDQYGVGTARKAPTVNDLEVAIEQLLAGEKVANAETAAVGCLIGRIRTPDSKSEITYSNQIARVFQKRCVECHREGEIAPFAMTSYEEVAGWAETIAEVVSNERMPPWHANPAHGSFRNSVRLSDDEKELIAKWVAAGAPEGNPKDLPTPKTYITGWQLPKEPEYVVYMREEPFTVPAEGTVSYQHFTVDPGFTEDKWVTAAEIIPENRAVVHHVLVFVRPKGAPGRGAAGQNGDGSLGFFAAYVPGFRPVPFPTGMAKRIPAGSQFVFQMHYTPNGTEQKDRSKMGLLFADPKDVTHMVKTVEAIQPQFEIPPGADNFRVDADSSGYDYDLQMISLSPHMHLRGKAFNYEARYPDGRRETLLDVPRYDFNWQTTYLLSEFKAMPKGTTIHCIAHYDNSANNPANPNPKETVKWGDQTYEEMMIGFFDVAVKVSQDDVLAGKLPQLTPSAEWQAQKLLERFDKDHDGKVTKDELPSRAQGIMTRLDQNKDEILTVEEVVQMIKMQQALRASGQAVDGIGQALRGFGGRFRRPAGDKNEKRDDSKQTPEETDTKNKPVEKTSTKAG